MTTQNIELLNPVEKIYSNQYHFFANLGKQHLKGKRVVFSLLTRNTEEIIERNISILVDTVKDYVDDYAFVIYENDSADKTKEIIGKISDKYPNKIHATLETHNRKHYGPVKDYDRALRLAEYRNHNLDVIKDRFNDFDYAIVCDSDFADISQKGLYNSFGWIDRFPEIDGIAGHAFQLRKYAENNYGLWNYDSWAFRDDWWEDLELEQKPFVRGRMTWFGLWIPPVGGPLKKVNSAFGGTAIYRTKTYTQGKYGAKSHTGKLDLDHAVLHYSLSQKKKDFLLCVNPSQIMLMN